MCNQIEQNLVSVIIPCFNSTNFVRPTLESIRDQIYDNVETIVVDDCSDDCDELIEILSEFDCQFVRLTEHVGASQARNVGFDKSSGEFLFFCDSDVELKKEAIFEMIDTLSCNLDCSWVYCNFNLGNREKVFKPFDKERMYVVNCSSTMSLIRRKDFPGFDKYIQKLQDWDLFLTMMEHGKRGKWLNKNLFTALDREEGITRNGLDEFVARDILRGKHPKIKDVKRK